MGCLWSRHCGRIRSYRKASGDMRNHSTIDLVMPRLSPAELQIDTINRKAWRAGGTLRHFARLRGYTDPGERAAIDRIAEEMADRPILDLGVGAGRTVPILRTISDDYVGIDYTPEMVALCRRKYPHAKISVGDARDLSRFERGTFALVCFSFNGIDAVNREDRKAVLREVHRVLQPGGVFLFSTHNRHGPGHGEHPGLDLSWSTNPLGIAKRAALSVVGLPRALFNHARFRRLNDPREDSSIMNAAAHGFGILVHYTTLEAEIRELAAAGFDANAEMYCRSGELISTQETLRGPGAWWFHMLARKPKRKILQA
jgi:SAM-dependent methyltransferase